MEQFREALRQLTATKKKIEDLTKLARDNSHLAFDVTECIVAEIRQAPSPQRVVALLYLVDSVVRTCGGDFSSYLGKSLPATYEAAYRAAAGDAKSRASLEQLLNIWTRDRTFPEQTLAKARDRAKAAADDAAPKPILKGPPAAPSAAAAPKAAPQASSAAASAGGAGAGVGAETGRGGAAAPPTSLPPNFVETLIRLCASDPQAAQHLAANPQIMEVVLKHKSGDGEGARQLLERACRALLQSGPSPLRSLIETALRLGPAGPVPAGPGPAMPHGVAPTGQAGAGSAAVKRRLEEPPAAKAAAGPAAAALPGAGGVMAGQARDPRMRRLPGAKAARVPAGRGPAAPGEPIIIDDTSPAQRPAGSQAAAGGRQPEVIDIDMEPPHGAAAPTRPGVIVAKPEPKPMPAGPPQQVAGGEGDDESIASLESLPVSPVSSSDSSLSDLSDFDAPAPPRQVSTASTDRQAAGGQAFTARLAASTNAGASVVSAALSAPESALEQLSHGALSLLLSELEEAVRCGGGTPAVSQLTATVRRLLSRKQASSSQPEAGAPRALARLQQYLKSRRTTSDEAAARQDATSGRRYVGIPDAAEARKQALSGLPPHVTGTMQQRCLESSDFQQVMLAGLSVREAVTLVEGVALMTHAVSRARGDTFAAAALRTAPAPLDPIALKRGANQDILEALHQESLRQCAVCGLRVISADPEACDRVLARHMDLHFARNDESRRRKNKAGPRKWMPPAKTWCKVAAQAEPHRTTEAAEQDRQTAATSGPSVPADPSKSVCPACGEGFVQRWSAALRDFSIVGCVAVDAATWSTVQLDASSAASAPHFPQRVLLFHSRCWHDGVGQFGRVCHHTRPGPAVIQVPAPAVQPVTRF